MKKMIIVLCLIVTAVTTILYVEELNKNKQLKDKVAYQEYLIEDLEIDVKNLLVPEALTINDNPNLRFPEIDHQLLSDILDSCEVYNVPIPLVLAIAEVESNFNPNAISETSDYGLCQINSFWCSYFDCTTQDLLDPEFNLKCGCKLLHKYLLDNDGSITSAIQLYHFGHKVNYISGYEEKVMQAYNKYLNR